MSNGLKVQKRDGRVESIDLEKMHKMVDAACEGLSGVSASQVEIQSGIQFYDGITTAEIQEILVKSANDFSKNKSVKIDFSLTKRYTDEFQTNSNVIYVRTDYLDEFIYFKKGDSRDNLKFSSFEPYDYFKISTTNTIKYKLKFGREEKDENSLLFLVWNIFLQNDESLDFNTLSFREGQLPIIANALSKNDTIGLLPTGSGKSVCYQLSAILQPAISFVVCPIKSLMYDQKADLYSAFFSRINHITSDDDGEDKEKIQNEFRQGKYFFIFISTIHTSIQWITIYQASI